MRHLTRVKRPDGITELRPRSERVEHHEWYLAAFTALLFTIALFVSAAIPPALFVAMVVSVAIGEVLLGLRTLLELRRPRADVLVLARRSR
jgi:uncharacterized membrane-anchored protein